MLEKINEFVPIANLLLTFFCLVLACRKTKKDQLKELGFVMESMV